MLAELRRMVLREIYQDRVERVNQRFVRRFGRSLRPGEIVRVLSAMDRRLAQTEEERE